MMMRQPDSISASRRLSAAISAEACIAIGLVWLIVVACWPAVPAVSAMSLVTLGATQVVLKRFGNAPALIPLALLHATIYGALYALFVGSSLDVARAQQPTASIAFLSAVDLIASTLPMAAALRRITSAIASQDMFGSR